MILSEVKKLKYSRLSEIDKKLIYITDGILCVEFPEESGEFIFIKDDYCYFMYDSNNKILYFDSIIPTNKIFIGDIELTITKHLEKLFRLNISKAIGMQQILKIVLNNYKKSLLNEYRRN